MWERIDFGYIVRRVLRQWFIILMISVSVTLVVGIITSRQYRPSYQTQALIVVYDRKNESSGISAAMNTVSTFSEILTSNLLQKKIAEQLNMPGLPGSIWCEAIYNTNMLYVKASGASPKDVMTVMNGFLDYYHVVTKEILSDVVLHVLEAPTVPTVSVATYNETKIMVMAFAVCFLACCGVLFIYYYLRDDIKSEHQIEKKLDTKLFATVHHENMKEGFRLPFRKKKKTGLLVTNPTTSFGYTETFQKIVTKLEYQTKHKGYRVIALSSVKENEGKSTVAANIALTLANAGKTVLLVDFDLRKPAIFKLFEIPYKKDQPQVADLLLGEAELEETAIQWKDMNLSIVAGNRSYNNSVKLLLSEHIGQVMEVMKQNVDYVIIDTPPFSLLADAEEIMRYADAGLLVVSQGVAMTKDINDMIDVFRSTGCKLLGCIYNNVEVGLLGKKILTGDKYGYGYEYSNRYGKEKMK